MASATQSRYLATSTRANSNTTAQPWSSVAYSAKSSTNAVKSASSGATVNAQNAKKVATSTASSNANNSVSSGSSESNGSNSMSLSDAYSLAADYARESQSWSASEAQKQRDWEEYMSNTSYQRAVADLKAAGLNPVLAAKIAGASTPSGASASDSSMSSISSGIISSAASQYASDVNRQNVLDQITSSHELAYISGSYGVKQSSIVAGATINAAQISAAAAMYGSDNNLQAALNQADKALEGTKYSSNKSYNGVVYSSDSAFQKAVYQSAVDAYIENTYPSTMWASIKGTVKDWGYLLSGNGTTTDHVAQCIGKLNSIYGNGK